MWARIPCATFFSHRALMHMGRSHTCKECGQQFSQKSSLIKHHQSVHMVSVSAMWLWYREINKLRKWGFVGGGGLHNFEVINNKPVWQKTIQMYFKYKCKEKNINLKMVLGLKAHYNSIGLFGHVWISMTSEFSALICQHCITAYSKSKKRIKDLTVKFS
jgi:hypothetical protein